jgi:hypothetical protein
MKNSVVLILFLLSSLVSASQYFSFQVKGIDLVPGYDSVFILESSEEMKSFSDRIVLDCQGFLSQLAFYNDMKNGEGGAPEEIYDLDHDYCEKMAYQIFDFSNKEVDVCVELNISEYNPPLVYSGKCSR